MNLRSDRARRLDRARGSLMGFAIGDALGRPAQNLTPEQIRNRWGRLTGFVHGAPITEDTEYPVFAALLLARYGRSLTSQHVASAWQSEGLQHIDRYPFPVVDTDTFFGDFVTTSSSDSQHHAWSDALAIRAAPYGIFAAGHPDEAARLVAVDGITSHEGEGIYSGQAVAAGIAIAMTDATPSDVLEAALSVIPRDCWTARSLRRAAAAVDEGGHVEDKVHQAVVLGAYPWMDLAPEAVALAFGAFLAGRGRFAGSVLTAIQNGRDANAIAGIAGALAGALNGYSVIPEEWATVIGPMRGTRLPAVTGRRIADVADQLVAAASREPTWAG